MVGAIRGVAYTFNFTLTTLAYSPSTGGVEKPRSHQGVVLEMSLAEMVSEDSGYWDYALLMYYDEALHVAVLSGLTGLTNFGWAERAALLASGS